LNWIWAIGNRVWWGLLVLPLSLIPLGGIAAAIYLGHKGNQLAWRKKRWESIEQFKRSQRRWRNVGIAWACVVVSLIALVFAFAISDEARTVANQPQAASFDPDLTRTLHSADQEISLRVPGDWSLADDLDEEAVIQADNRWSELYVIVLEAPKANITAGTTLRQLADASATAIVQSLSGQPAGAAEGVSADVPDATAVRYQSGPALEREVRGAFESTRIVMIHSMVETPDRFIEIMAWTIPSQWERARSTLEQVVRSITVNAQSSA
jgi:hypothetical protein